MKTITVEVDAGNVVTIDALAEDYGKLFSVAARPDASGRRIEFTTRDGTEAHVDETGFARRNADGSPIREYDTDWAEDVLDAPDVVWARDGNGRLVALTN